MGAFDVAVVGGGIVGAAFAWAWARRGLSVVIVDAGPGEFSATRGTFGNITVQGKGFGMPAYACWTERSSQLWPELAGVLREETGVDIGFHRPGFLHCCVGDDALEARRALVERVQAEDSPAGSDLTMLDAVEARALVPGLGPAVSGGSYCPRDAQCNPLRLWRALRAGYLARGGVLLPGRRVTGVRPEGDGYRIDTDGGVLDAGRVLIAAGLGMPPLAAQLGIPLPLYPLRGEILATAKLAPMLTVALNGVRQTEEGTVLIGQSSEKAGYDEGTNLPVTAGEAANAVTLLPALAGARLVRAWGSLRVMTPDKLPVYAEANEHRGVFAVTCHSGVTLCAAHALDLADRLLDDGVPSELYPFTATRFHVSEAA
ncbi:MAG: FAD-dependent oxidoreductase [Acetobacterales bacterium]